MLKFNWQPFSVLSSILVTVFLLINLSGCGDLQATLRDRSISSIDSPITPIISNQKSINGKISEVSPPETIDKLGDILAVYKPQVKILSPLPDTIFEDTTVEVKLQIEDLPVFKSPDLGLGPHIHLILDNQPYQAVYDVNQPVIFKDLAPGTHTIRAFASRPWHESFKNEGAFAQTTFHIFTKTANNNPDPQLPLLTYSRPNGVYGAEPIMLDFYLTNAPLHLVAQENSDDDVADWRIRVTINGESFVIDRWQPFYLKGFKTGKNWLKLEYLDEKGNPINNTFNNTVRVFTYEPKGKDTLSKLVRNELSVTELKSIVEQSYSVKPNPSPTPEVTPSSTPIPEVKTKEEIKPVPEVKTKEEIKPNSEVKTKEDVKPNSEVKTKEDVKPVPEITPTPTPTPEIKTTEEVKSTPSITPQTETSRPINS
ncbi:MAG TPA: hypothetical protein V6C58_14325 [Allocoleopsis sp.]